MKKIIALAVICCLLFTCLPSLAAGTEPEDAELFTQTQIASLDGPASFTIRQIVMLNDTLYACLDDASVYAWRINESNPRLFCRLPECPEPASVAYGALPDDEKARWDETVSFLAAGDGALWGVNALIGKVGKVTEQGIQWGTVRLDVSPLMPDENPWPLRVVNAFVSNNVLYTCLALDNGVYPQNNYQLFAFDLSTGSCTELDIRNAQGLCAYRPGFVLLLQSAENNVWSVEVMDLSTGAISPSAFQPFSSASDKPIGGLVYDAASDSLLFTNQSQVWKAAEGQAYASVAIVPVPDMTGETVAFALDDGRYALCSDCLYVRNVGAVIAAPETLSVSGCMDDTVYQSFAGENPNISVDFKTHLLSADEIAQALVTGDQTADLYATFANNTFSAIVKKGYAAELNASEVLTSDILTMYPNIQHAITDEAGNPVAYPYKLLLDHWQVNDTLWKQVFGDTPVPATYDQFLDAMLLWETTYADEYPDLAFAGDFDHAYWIRKLMNAYAQQYGQADTPVDISSPVLRGALEKLEQVRDARSENGRNTAFLGDGQYIPKEDIFITAGFNNVLLDPAATATDPDDSEAEGIYTDMPALVFSQGEQSQIPGEMIVWFVNPYSQHKELAIRYLEYAARKQNNPVTYCATHPDDNEPLEREGYAASAEKLEKQRDEIKASLKTAEGTQFAGLKDQLASVEAGLQTLEKQRWQISPNAIESYRSFAPSISFYEDNPYITPDGSAMLAQLESLYQRYTDGLVDLDGFLRELDQKMRMLYLEAK
ncbi:MAG TPA: hypothetical protein PKN45_03000 [Candidatus Limiplasma sp.]|nr:hypothetical protein [Candidatus Limiplasma sp.]